LPGSGGGLADWRLAYAATAAAVGIAFIIRAAFSSLPGGRRVFVFFVPTIMLGAALGGLSGGGRATLLMSKMHAGGLSELVRSALLAGVLDT
jgi:hypothetical protein